MSKWDMDNRFAYYTPVAMENGPFEDVFPTKKGNFPLPC